MYDGFGRQGRSADVAVSGGRVVTVGRDLGAARQTIDATGLAVAPGFVDPHSHSDTVPFLDEAQPFKLLQGVTTEIVGNCGFSCGPSDPSTEEIVALETGGHVFASFGDYLDAASAAGPTNNLAALLGHNTLRVALGGLDSALPSGALDRMCNLAAEAFDAGAVGWSTGLEYVPGAYADRFELNALAQVARRWGRTYATHMRSESEGLLDAVDEAIAVARSAGLRLQISHCKASGHRMHGSARLLLEKIVEARRSGVNVLADVYPYTACSTDLVAVLPPIACEGGDTELLKRLADPEERAALRLLAEDPDNGTGVGLWRELHPEDLQILTHADPAVAGRRLSDLVVDRDPWEVLCSIVSRDPHADTVLHTMREDDVTTFLSDPLVSIGSDNGLPFGPNHPRTFGTFPTFLGEYVRERGVVAMGEAIRKITSATADQFGLAARGWLGNGAVADICVFDPARIGHAGTYERPAERPVGVEWVLLGGRVVVDRGEFVGGREGLVLRPGQK